MLRFTSSTADAAAAREMKKILQIHRSPRESFHLLPALETNVIKK
jgi:hypothetical protein